MPQTISIGNQDFESIRMADDFYIDKTYFIKEWWENRDSVTLITRPRRFGKTLMLSTIEKFFSIQYADRGELFEGLQIWKQDEYRNLQGTYPVINVSFAQVKENTYEKMLKKMRMLIAELYRRYDFLLSSKKLNETDKKHFREILEEREDDIYCASAIKLLSQYLYLHYGKKVIILIDEYDTPMQEAYVSGYWDEVVLFTRGMFHDAFKSNPHLERGLMTGITRVSKESIFSDLNNLKIVSVMSDKYPDSFGFTEKEVFDALDRHGLADKKEEVKQWYDGFVFGGIKDIYNPWSICNYLDEGRLGCYWANTSSNSLINKLLKSANTDIKKMFQQLLQGEEIETEIDEQIVFNQLDENEDAIWSLLLGTGYLKLSSIDIYGMARLSITNFEVQLMLKKKVRGWFKSSDGKYNAFVRALLKGELKAMNAYMNDVALKTFSYFDTGKSPSERSEPEKFYHGFVLGLMVDLEKRYVLSSNRESGFGRYDVMLEPKNEEDDAILIEFKVIDKEEEKDLRETAQSALKQIEDMQYEQSLLAKGIDKERIRKYGFAFEGKKVVILAEER